MTGSIWLDGAGIALAAWWVLSLLLVWRALPILEPVSSWREGEAPPPGGWPRVSIIVPCRDEEAHIEPAMASLLALDYPDFEVIAVDDRSLDGTGAILERLAKDQGRLRIIHITDVPPGWLGKTNALRRGAEAASGDWLLFTDADVRHHPLTLRRTVGRAELRGLALLSLFPRNVGQDMIIRCMQHLMVFFSVFGLGLWAHSRKRQSFVAAGAGAFLLARKSAYERAGGHAAIRLAVVDDFALPQAIRRSGGLTELAAGGSWVDVPYAATVRDLFHVFRKNGFAIFGYSWPLLLGFTALAIITQCVPPLLFLIDWRLWPCSLAVWLSLAGIYRMLAPISGAPAMYFLIHPVASFITALPGWISAIAVTREGGVSWRGSFYPLRELRENRPSRLRAGRMGRDPGAGQR